MTPSGYWYIIAYEQVPQTSTWGASADWKSFVYYTGRPMDGVTAQGMVVQARFEHDKPYTPGAVRSYWWNGRSWVLWTRDGMVQDWGTPRSDAASVPIEAPPVTPPVQGGVSWWLVALPIVIVGAIFYDVVGPRRWT